MRYVKIKKTKLLGFIDELARHYDVYGPAKRGNDVIFTKLQNSGEFVDAHTLLGVKQFVTPPTEVLFSIKMDKILEPEQPKTKLLIGTRSCDIAAFRMMDDVFLKEYRDTYYENRRKALIILNFACTEPCKFAFCTTFQGPHLKDGFDLQFIDIGQYYLVEQINQDIQSEYFEDATSADIDKAMKNIENMYIKIKPLNVENIHNKLQWDDTIWKELGDQCISCGACNYACPTCFCFDVYDVYSDNGINRVREWDSCLLSGFTRMAMYANPRSQIEQRIRQRFMHKLKYHAENYGYALCTGCGRCIETCPVEIDIRKVITHFGGVVNASNDTSTSQD